MPRRLLIAGALAAIFVATLYPASGEGHEPLVLCIVCGEQGVSDAVTNLLLFIPLGAALAFAGWRGAAVTIAAALLSTGIEGAQLVIPGRDPSIGDILFNTLGGAVGSAIVASATHWLTPTRRGARILLVAATGCGAALLTFGGWLLQPALPEATYYGQWTPNLGHLEWYRARVLEVVLGDLPLPPHRLPDAAALRRLLFGGATLRVRALAGAPTGGVGSLFSVYDDQQREILLLGPDRADFVFRYRRRAAGFGLDAPDLRLLDGARGLRRGDTLTVTLLHGWCLQVSERSACGLGDPPGRAWALLLYPESFPPWLRRLLDAGWLAGLWLAVGLWGRRAGLGFTAASAGCLAVACAIVPSVMGLRPLSGLEMGGCVAGVLVGYGLSRWTSAAATAATSGPTPL